MNEPIYLSQTVKELWRCWRYRKVKLTLPLGEDWRVIDRNETALTRGEQIMFDEIKERM